jgi:hypothetical protein
MKEDDNLNFVPKPINSANLRLGDGTKFQTPIGLIQKLAAVRAYIGCSSLSDWMDKLSSAYVVAIATRSADMLLMLHIQSDLNNSMSFTCENCKEASIGASLIRERLFPKLKELREHANKLVHHLDVPGRTGIAGLNIEGVYDYCYHLFQENDDALFCNIPNPTGKFPYKRCKKCRTATQPVSVEPADCQTTGK